VNRHQHIIDHSHLEIEATPDSQCLLHSNGALLLRIVQSIASPSGRWRARISGVGGFLPRFKFFHRIFIAIPETSIPFHFISFEWKSELIRIESGAFTGSQLRSIVILRKFEVFCSACFSHSQSQNLAFVSFESHSRWRRIKSNLQDLRALDFTHL
jgi:hypothetical protein